MADDIVAIVLTGGPMGGKSTCFDQVKREFGSLVYPVHEAATALFNSGIKLPSGPNSDEQSDLLQEIIWRYQYYIETQAIPDAQAQGARVILFDRGLLDGAAYMPGGRAELLKRLNKPLEELFAKVDVVVHLESVAVTKPDLFGSAGNAFRYETADQARELDERVREAWEGHPDWRFVSSGAGIDGVTSQVMDIVRTFLYSEIERKWWLKTLPTIPSWVVPQQIEQFYLVAGDGVELRLRRIDDRYVETKKIGSGLSRFEHDEPIKPEVYQAFLPQANGSIVRKLRYNVPDTYGRHVSVDVYQDQLSGLIVAEKEFAKVEQAQQYTLPDWLITAGTVEVTGQADFKNVNLARYGLP